jgi:hypothetical protein
MSQMPSDPLWTVRGIVSTQNTCFLSASMQALLASSSFRGACRALAKPAHVISRVSAGPPSSSSSSPPARTPVLQTKRHPFLSCTLQLSSQYLLGARGPGGGGVSVVARHSTAAPASLISGVAVAHPLSAAAALGGVAGSTLSKNARRRARRKQNLKAQSQQQTEQTEEACVDSDTEADSKHQGADAGGDEKKSTTTSVQSSAGAQTSAAAQAHVEAEMKALSGPVQCVVMEPLLRLFQKHRIGRHEGMPDWC